VPITTDVVGSNFDLIKLVCDLRQIGGSPNKTDRHDITEILLKVALNTIKQTWVNSDVRDGEAVLASYKTPSCYSYTVKASQSLGSDTHTLF
jgi:hypothetical protein